MRQIFFALGASVLLLSPVVAQSPAAPPADQNDVPPEAVPDGGPGGAKPAGGAGPAAPGNPMKALFADCRKQAQAQGVRGRQMRDAVSACIVKQRPDLAGRMKCRSEGMDKGLRKDDLRSYVRTCLQQEKH